MVDRTDGLLYQTGQGYSALDAQSARDRLDGYAVVSGLDVSPGGSLSVDVTAGEAIVGTDTNGDTITVSPGATQTVSLTAADSANPRKDTVWIDDTGTAQVTTGTAESALPEGNSRFNTFQPEPPFPGGDGTILAEVYVAAGASSLTSADIRDRRQPAQIVGADAQVASVTGAGGTGVHDDATQTVGDGTTNADHESVSTGELNGKEATLTTDDTGEYRLVTTIGISSLWTTTNTSFEIVPDTKDAAIFDREKIGTNTNISSDLFVSVNYNGPATTASGTIRVAMSPNTEVGVGPGTDFGPIGLWEDPSDRVSFELRSADGSQVEVRGVSINIWEQIA